MLAAVIKHQCCEKEFEWYKAQYLTQNSRYWFRLVVIYHHSQSFSFRKGNEVCDKICALLRALFEFLSAIAIEFCIGFSVSVQDLAQP